MLAGRGSKYVSRRQAGSQSERAREKGSSELLLLLLEARPAARIRDRPTDWDALEGHVRFSVASTERARRGVAQRGANVYRTGNAGDFPRKPVEQPVAGPALRRAGAVWEPGVYDRVRSVAGAGHRSEYRHLSVAGLGAPAHPAGERPAGAGDHSHCKPEKRQRQLQGAL